MNLKKKRKHIIVISSLMGIIVLLLIAGSQGWIGKDNLPRVAVDTVKTRDIIASITASGKIQPETEVIISPDVSGEIVALNVRDGQKVEQGGLLLKIKPEIYVSSLERAEAALNTARANLANARARLAQVKAEATKARLAYTRNKKLHEQGAISQAEYEQFQANYEIAQAQVNAAGESVNASRFNVKSAQASVNEAKENLQKTKIFAPISGTITRLNVEKGERVVGTMQMSGTDMLRIANLNHMEAIVEVNENDIIHVSLQDTALIEVDAYLGQQFKGLVTEIANSAQGGTASLEQVTNFEVKIAILPTSYAHLIQEGQTNAYPLRPGMSATVDIQTDYRNQVPSIAIQAVTARKDSFPKFTENGIDPARTSFRQQEVIFIYDGHKAQQRMVRTGIQDNQYIEIETGAKEGQAIITAPFNMVSKHLHDGMQVQQVPREQLFTGQ